MPLNHFFQMEKTSRSKSSIDSESKRLRTFVELPIPNQESEITVPVYSFSSHAEDIESYTGERSSIKVGGGTALVKFTGEYITSLEFLAYEKVDSKPGVLILKKIKTTSCQVLPERYLPDDDDTKYKLQSMILEFSDNPFPKRIHFVLVKPGCEEKEYQDFLNSLDSEECQSSVDAFKSRLLDAQFNRVEGISVLPQNDYFFEFPEDKKGSKTLKSYFRKA